MAHFNTNTVVIDGKSVKTYTLLNLDSAQIYVINCALQGLPIPDSLNKVATNLKAQISQMSDGIKIDG